MKRLLYIIVFFYYSLPMGAQNYELIPARKLPVVDTFYQSFTIEDDYRWMEKMDSDELRQWVKLQNKQTKRFLAQIPKHKRFESKILDYSRYDYEKKLKNNMPDFDSVHQYNFEYQVYDDVSMRVLAYKGKGIHDYRVLVDPYDISETDNIYIMDYWSSTGEKYLAYEFSRNGSDKMEARIVSLADRKQLPDVLKGLMFTKLVWYKNDGFFYSTYDRKDKFGITSGQKVWYHKVGTGQYEDKLIFERKHFQNNNFRFKIVGNQKYLILDEYFPGKDKMNVFYFDLKTGNFNVKPLITNLNAKISVVGFRDGKFIAESAIGSGNGMVFEIDPAHPYKWKALTPYYSEAVLNSYLLSKKYIATVYLASNPVLVLLDYNMKVVHTVMLPKSTSPTIIGIKDNYLYYAYSSYTVPPVRFRLNLDNFKKTLVAKALVHYDFNKIVFENVEYVSNDSTKIPLTIVHRKDLVKDGSAPALLTAYGGYGVIDAPAFNPAIVAFVLGGGVYAYAHIRGGGEKGVKWAKAGRGFKKQQSFDDFAAAARYLINSRYTGSEHLASYGASNGGLVVAATAIQNPDLFKLVIPEVAVTDMLRFEKFTVGHFWADEYGTVNDSLSFLNLLSYAPYQNIRDEVNYPMMLVITSDHDDRVPPLHSYKFVARLQNRDAQGNPVYLMVEKKGGHNGVITNKSITNKMIDVYGLVLYEL